MKKNKTFWLGLVAALALAVTGCSDDNNDNGTGGMGGEGGTGGTPAATANVTAVHLAPEVPSAEDTEVALYVNGEEFTDMIGGATLEYGQSSGKIEVPATTYDSIGVGLPGGDGPVAALENVTLNDGDDVVVVAYRTGDEDLVTFFVFVNSTDGLAEGNGRVFVGHGADDPALDPVNVSTGSEETMDCATLIPGFEFGTIFPETVGDADLPEGTYPIGFDVAEDACPEVGPVDVPVNPDVVSILVAVDEDTTEGLNPELWAIIPDLEDPQPIRTVQTDQ